jgi:hypothetical protein
MLRHNKAIQINFLLAIVFFAAGCAPSAPLAISLAVNKVPTVPLNIGAGTRYTFPSSTKGHRRSWATERWFSGGKV